uniref:Fe2OG dioxygenase domain-containing protein n=1 Tax=Entomoneis paludosa TaxID=265537 RepID=A0A7S2YGP5_9STRA|mmetsp:Transcript_32416/g.67601  ORF Transcript_32416/g.67601 Transcript_32416/m.67601 type:complete len:491 (+) Transcript_32416:54-1526(+)
MIVSRVSSMAVLAIALSGVPAIQGFWTSSSETDKETEKTVDATPTEKLDYGVDISFPMHYPRVSTNYDWLPHNQDPSLTTPREYEGMPIQYFGDKQKWYDEFIEGCVKYYGRKGHRCRETERDRVEMSLRQPQSMQNYTKVGYRKIRAPDAVWKLVKQFWDQNSEVRKLEQWGVGNTYTNNWESPTYMISVEDKSLRGAGGRLKQAIWNAARDTLSAWTGQELTQCSLYGIRVYTEGAVLATHVDRMPLVSSAILNVAQDVDEPWPLEVIGHDGKAENVTMLPGDMVLYESHSVLHGRPFPLKGRYMANIFIHFEPTGHSLRHNMGLDPKQHDVDQAYRDSFEALKAGHEHENDALPPYIVEGSPEDSRYRQTHPGGFNKKNKPGFTTGSTNAHQAAQEGDLSMLKEHVTKDKQVVNKQDANGWTPLHEATRAGHFDMVKYLIEQGADPNIKTGKRGGTALWWAKNEHDEDHPIIEFLESIGAMESGPEL